MPAFTPFLSLYKPGGGSTGAITPDEVVDIDRLNANFDTIDSNAQSNGSRLDTLESGKGLVTVRPETISGKLTLNPDGSMTATNYTPGAFNIRGLFKPEYDRYRAVITLAGKAAITSAGFFVCQYGAGSTSQSANYFNQETNLLNGTATSSASGNTTTFGSIFDGSGRNVHAVLDILILNDGAVLITSSVVARLGQVFAAQKYASVEGMPSRATGLGVELGQNVASVYMKFYAYA